MGNKLAPMASRHPRMTSRTANGGASDDGGGAARDPDRLVAVSSRGVFDEEADFELLDTTSGSGSRVVARAAGCAGPSYPCNPPMRAHLGLVLIAGKGRRLRVVDPFAGAVSVLPPEPDHGKTLAASFSVLGRACSVGRDYDGGEYKVFSVTVDHYLVQSCKVLTLGAGVGVGVGVDGDVGGAWREAEKPPTFVRCGKPWVAAVAGGVVYVLAFHRREKSNWIAAFDLGTEQWRRGLLQGPPAPTAVSGLTDGYLATVSVSSDSEDTSSSSVHLWLLVSCGDGEPALWQHVCTVPMSRIRRRTSHGVEVVEEPVWVLNGGRVAFVVGTPLQQQQQAGRHGSGGAAAGDGAGGERGCLDWVLRVYDPRTNAFEDVARLSSPTDVAIGACTRSLL